MKTTWILVNPNGEDWWEQAGVLAVEISVEDLELLKTGALPGDVKPINRIELGSMNVDADGS
jgi:hypothetical protein